MEPRIVVIGIHNFGNCFNSPARLGKVLLVHTFWFTNMCSGNNISFYLGNVALILKQCIFGNVYLNGKTYITSTGTSETRAGSADKSKEFRKLFPKQKLQLFSRKVSPSSSSLITEKKVKECSRNCGKRWHNKYYRFLSLNSADFFLAVRFHILMMKLSTPGAKIKGILSVIFSS